MDADVVELIMADHREVERLFGILQTQPDQRTLVMPVVTALLVAHSRAEEAEVYPVARSEAGAAEEVEHSQEEHLFAEQLLGRLAGADPAGSDFERLLQETVDAVTHHVEEEESSVLPAMRNRLPSQRRAELAERFAAARAEHLGEMPGDASKESLDLQAQNLDLEGRSAMDKPELQRALSRRAEE